MHEMQKEDIYDFLSDNESVERAVQRFFVPQAYARKEQEVALWNSGTPLRLHAGTLEAREWGAGPLVVLAHGWEGRGSQWYAFVDLLVTAGLRVIALDAPAHGDSAGTTMDPWHYAQALLQVGREVGPMAGLIGHSMGASACILAIDQGLVVEKLVVIASPNSLIEVMKRYARAIDLAPRLYPAFSQRVAAHVAVPLDALDLASVAARQKIPALFFHDPEDREVPFSDGEAVSVAWPGSHMRSVHGLGHRRIIRDLTVARESVAFLVSKQD
ncbi:alpha/beta hydrolase [Ktedonobacteria bacterium brp13]|nr:alpha/beta hydrolase [Ktedonobacteria bacterium brp13]